jgi:ArsR family transcriptional regulator
MITDTQLVSLENTFKALADVTRLRILGLLRAGEICVCHIHESLGLPQPTVSRHLAYLRKSGLVATRRDGLWIHYRLAELSDPVMRALVDAVTHAIGHVESGSRDRRRLARRIELMPLESRAPERCCQP